MITAASAPAGPPWVQILLSAVGLLGGTGGVTAIATVALQRRKFRADAADVLTDTALTLVDPLKTRVAELEAETKRARRQAADASREIRELRAEVQEMTDLIRRWQRAIFASDATIEHLREYILAADSGGGPGSRP
ncbi:hypothetical protein OG792_07940 [Micromonospora sp. NBC_01699]|uniref:hypothetical protein n=1 Tax=Micromonospora sp. NBC_01699 TaxID=2975984 RepID=UPI002E37D75F|nr:hypothetical protein [Micromonospora sp. NBC_01699]